MLAIEKTYARAKINQKKLKIVVQDSGLGAFFMRVTSKLRGKTRTHTQSACKYLIRGWLGKKVKLNLILDTPRTCHLSWCRDTYSVLLASQVVNKKLILRLIGISRLYIAVDKPM